MMWAAAVVVVLLDLAVGLVSAHNASVKFSSGFGNLVWTESTTAPTGYWKGLAGSSDGKKLIGACNVVGANGTTIYTSSDFGATWQNSYIWNIQIDFNYALAVASSSDGGRFYVGLEQISGLYTSTDVGRSWTLLKPVDTAVYSPYWNAIGCDYSGQHVYAAVDGGAIYYSSDYGSSFRKGNSGTGRWRFLSINPVDGGYGYSSKDTFLYTTNNGGQSWGIPQSMVPSAFHDVSYSPDSNRVVAVGGADDGGENNVIYNLWGFNSVTTSGVCNGCNYATAVQDLNYNTLVAVSGSTGNGLYVSEDQGRTFSQTTAPAGVNWLKIKCNQQGTVCAAVASGSKGKFYSAKAAI